MKNKSVITIIVLSGMFLISCSNNAKEEKEDEHAIEMKIEYSDQMMKVDDQRISLNLNPMQKQHQLKNMRSHLEAVQQIITLVSNNDFSKASEVAYTKLGSTTEMKLMCASFGDKEFENLGLEFHKSADKMSEILKDKNAKASLNALSNTMSYCIQCHATYRQ